uniref:Uncharacterized protein n=1 Tax=Anguilla anguilla TaxID=7936 RepID=A0A0E9W430_ANGAN
MSGKQKFHRTVRHQYKSRTFSTLCVFGKGECAPQGVVKIRTYLCNDCCTSWN